MMRSHDGAEKSHSQGLAAFAFDLRHITPAELALLGISQLAYVKPVSVGGEDVFAIHAADGTPMAIAPNRELALGAIIEHEMVPALVH